MFPFFLFIVNYFFACKFSDFFRDFQIFGGKRMHLPFANCPNCPIVPSAVNTAEVSDFAGHFGTKKIGIKQWKTLTGQYSPSKQRILFLSLGDAMPKYN